MKVKNDKIKKIKEGYGDKGAGKTESKARPQPLRRCRVCGCTDKSACPGGCFWVSDNLCSNCAGPKPAEKTLAERLGKKEPEQGFLFGEADKVKSALSSELAIVKDEIKRTEVRQLAVEGSLFALEDRRRIIEDAMKTLDKAQGEKVAAKKPKKKPDKKSKVPAKKPKD